MTCVISLEEATDRAAADPSSDVIAVARAAAMDEADTPDAVGEYAGAFVEDDAAVTVTFQALLRGYSGWRWSVVVAHAAEVAPETRWTVSEAVLLPGPEALIAPTWVPWDRRVQQGDLGVGDLLATEADDDRLVPAYLQSDDPEIERTALELGLGRIRVLSRDGRTDVAERWHEGAFGPGDPMAAAAPGHCGRCGFFLPLAGSLGGMFGVCSNEMAPGDSRVVDVEYGCGAHSEAVAPLLVPTPPTDVVIDELQLDVHHRTATEDAAAEDAAPKDAAPEDAAADGSLLPQDAVVDVTLVNDEITDVNVQGDSTVDETAALAAVLELLPAPARLALTAADAEADGGVDSVADVGVEVDAPPTTEA